MFLKKKKAQIPDAPRNQLEATASMGVSPGQKILALTTAIIGSGLILGAVGYKYVLPALSGDQQAKPAPKPEQTASTPQVAPALNVPLELNTQPEAPMPQAGVFPSPPPGMQPPANQGPLIGANTGAKQPPPGLIGSPGAGSGNGGIGQDESIELARQRKMQGELGTFSSSTAEQGAGPQATNAQANQGSAARTTQATPAAANSSLLQGAGSGATILANLLNPTATPSGSASYMGNQHLTLAKGTSITCNLDTAIQTDQPGFVSCLTDYPIRSMDGKVILAERGTKIEGEYQRGVEPGQKAIFVLWTRARTPTGVIFNLASPGTDALGRAGISGEVDNKFWERFGGALMFSMLQDTSSAVSSRIAKESSDGSGRDVFILPNTQQTGQTAIGEVLKQGNSIKPTLYKNQGETVAITVARDIDFSPVYRLSAETR